MWIYEKSLQHPVKVTCPDVAFAKLVITQYGGPDGELGASLRYLNQRYSMPTNKAIALLTDIGTEELAHMEMIAALVYKLTEGASPKDYEAVSFDEKAFQQSHLFLWNYVANKPAYEKVTKALYKAQLFSKEQHNSQLPDETLLDITFTKGGYSVLLCRYYLDLPANATEEACWFQIGTIIQLTNDLFDIYKDLNDHIDTLPNRMTNAYVFEQFFREQMAKMDSLIRQLPYGHQRLQGFRLAMSGIYGLGLVAIDQLKAIQGDLLQLPDFKSLPRKALIVDMEKTRNLVKCLRHAYKSWRS